MIEGVPFYCVYVLYECSALSIAATVYLVHMHILLTLQVNYIHISLHVFQMEMANVCICIVQFILLYRRIN